MTKAIVLDPIDELAASVFEGYVVRKDLALQFKGSYPVPTYVGEFLIGRYCATTDPEEAARSPPRPTPKPAGCGSAATPRTSTWR